jgi:hypothetical protein
MRGMWAGARLSRRELLSLGTGAMALAASSANAAPKFPVGVFVSSPDETIELRAYADHHGFGRLTLAQGLLADIPAVPRIPVVLCNLPTWWLQTMWLASQRIFYDDTAERRQLNYTARRYSVTAIGASVRELNDAAGIAKLMNAVGASEVNPAYVVVALTNGHVVRDYLVELRPDS